MNQQSTGYGTHQPFLQPILSCNLTIAPQISTSDHLLGYKFLGLLGEGGFGKVHLAEGTDKKYYAVKSAVRNQVSQSDPKEKALVNEYNILTQLTHINIVKVFHLSKTVTNWYLVMEFMDKGSIKQTIDRHGPLKESYVKYITRQGLNGLDFLHSKNIVHRDIKADNLLLNSRGILKIGDFGITNRLYLVHGGNYGLQTKAGTPSHVAPEVKFAGSDLFPNCPNFYGAPVDIWSLGCTVMEMLTGRYPDSEGYFKSIYWGHPPFDAYRPENISIDCWIFIRSCLYPDPNVRLPAHVLKIHPWQIFC